MNLTDEQKQSYQKDGIIMFENVVPHDLIDEYNDKVAEYRKHAERQRINMDSVIESVVYM